MTKRSWFITGINSGFGRTLTTRLLEGGDTVAGTVRQPGSVDDLSNTYGDRLHVNILDVTDTAAVKIVVDRAFETVGRIDVVVNNAGYGLFGAAEEVTDQQIVHVIGTNLIGPISVTRAALPHLRAQGGGRIVQFSTVGGEIAAPGGSLYAATKWGIEGFMDSLVAEVAPFGIGVTIVAPGGARTAFRTGGMQVGEPMSAYDGTPAAMVRGVKDAQFREPGDPERIAAIIIDSVEQVVAPRRLVLGKSSYDPIHAALTDRLAELEAQEDLAVSADFPIGQ